MLLGQMGSSMYVESLKIVWLSYKCTQYIKLDKIL